MIISPRHPHASFSIFFCKIRSVSVFQNYIGSNYVMHERNIITDTMKLTFWSISFPNASNLITLTRVLVTRDSVEQQIFEAIRFLDRERRIILRWILRERVWGCRLCNGSGKDSVAGLYEDSNRTPGSIQDGEVLLRLSASQEWPFSMDSVL
jgi:hypothetical protein